MWGAWEAKWEVEGRENAVNSGKSKAQEAVDFPATVLNSNEERRMREDSQKLQPLSISKSEYPLGCAYGQAHSRSISTHTHDARYKIQATSYKKIRNTRYIESKRVSPSQARHSKMFAQHNYRFGGLWEKYTRYKIQCWELKLMLMLKEKEKLPRPLQQRVESVLKQ